MNTKRGQVTLFVIIATLIIVGVIAMFYFTTLNKGQALGVGEAGKVKSYIDLCIQQTTETGLQSLGWQGGYIYPKNESIKYGLLDISYWDYSGQDISPSLNTLENQLSMFMNEFVPYCNDWSFFPGMNITAGNALTKTVINKDYLTIDVKWPVSVIDKNNRVTSFEQFSKKFYIRIGRIYNVSRQIVAEEIKNQNNFCISCINDLAFNNGLTVNMFYFEDSLIFTIYDMSSKINNTNYEFKFANKLK